MKKKYCIALVISLALAGCSDNADETNEENQSSGEETVSTVVEDIDFKKTLTQASELENVRQASILDVISSSENEITVSFEMESDECFGHNLTVRESESEVVVALETGQLPGVTPDTCVYGVFPYTATATLAEPIGDRVIIPAEVTAGFPEDSSTLQELADES